MTAREIGAEVAKRSSMAPGDVLNVIDTMMDIIHQNLLNSRSVCLDGLGTFTVTCRSAGNGVDTEDDVTSNQITELKVRFTPSYTRSKFEGTTRAMFAGVTFERIDNIKTRKKDSTPGGNDDDDFIDPEA